MKNERCQHKNIKLKKYFSKDEHLSGFKKYKVRKNDEEHFPRRLKY